MILFIYKILISQNKINNDTKIQLSEIKDSEIKTILLNSCFKISSEEKYKAGIIYESLADKNKRKYYDLIIDEDTMYHIKCIYTLAAENFKAAYIMSVDKKILNLE